MWMRFSLIVSALGWLAVLVKYAVKWWG